ncbi:MAG: protein kinase [Planctomycetes bacterium]|nr:protein kinase [Planctomycetota bacterium]
MGFLAGMRADRFARRRHHCYEQGDWDGLLAICREWLAGVPYDRKAYHDMAVACHRKGLESEAYEACRQIALNDFGVPPQKDPRDQVARAADLVRSGKVSLRYMLHYMVLGEILEAQQKEDEALEVFEALKVFDPHFADRHLHLARLHERRGELDRAAGRLATFLEDHPRRAEDCVRAIEAMLGRSPGNLPLVRVLVQAHQVRGTLESTLAEARDRARAGDPSALHYLGAATLRLGRLDEARSVYEALVATQPDDKNAYKGLAEALYARGEVAAAARPIQAIVLRFPECRDEAIGWYRCALAAHPEDRLLQGQLAVLFLRGGDLDRALEHYRPILDQRPGDEALRKQWDLLCTMARKRRVRELELLLDPSGVTDMERVTVEVEGKAVSLLTTEAFRRSLEHPETVPREEALVELGALYTELGEDREKAIRLFQQASRYDSRFKDQALYRLCMSFIEEGHFDLAARSFEQVDLNRLDVSEEDRKRLLYEMAQGYEGQGSLAEAARTYGEVLLLDVGYRDARERHAAVERARAGGAVRAVPVPVSSAEGSDRKRGLYQLAVRYEEEGLVDQARKVLGEILELDRDYGDARQRLASLAVRPDGGRYINRVLIGRGGMGTIWRAFDTQLRRVVALKEINEAYRDDAEALKRFRLEAEAAARIDHPGVVRIHDIVDGERLAIAMEFVEGRNIRDLLRESRRFTEARVRDLGARIAVVLAHVHEKGVIHRDVKPDNVIVMADGGVKLTDFGLACLVEASQASRLTRAGHVLGTALYMAPEQVRGQAVDARTDVYALGVTLYEMATGRPPFDSGDVAFRHVYEVPTPPRKQVAELTEDLQRTVLRCLAKEPAGRFPDCRALAAALRPA